MLSSINVVTEIKNMCHALDLERENTENVKYKRDVGRAGISGEIPIIPNLLDDVCNLLSTTNFNINLERL